MRPSDLLGQALTRVPVHFGMAVAGLTAFGIVGGLLGWVDPFWKGDKAAFLLTIGIPLLLFETFVFLLLLQWRSPSSKDRERTIAVALAAFVGGVGFPWLVAAMFGISRYFRSESIWLQLFGGAVACAAITSILTWLFARALASR